MGEVGEGRVRGERGIVVGVGFWSRRVLMKGWGGGHGLRDGFVRFNDWYYGLGEV